jgi:hypothetical protein
MDAETEELRYFSTTSGVIKENHENLGKIATDIKL